MASERNFEGNDNLPSEEDQFWELVSQKTGPQVHERIKSSASHLSEPVAVIISRLGILEEALIASYLSQSCGAPVWSFGDFSHYKLFGSINEEYCQANYCVVFERGKEVPILAMVNPLDRSIVRSIKFLTGQSPECCVITLTDFQNLSENSFKLNIEHMESFPTSDDVYWSGDLLALKDIAQGAPVIKRVEKLLATAVSLGASDIHVEPSADRTRIRYRVDGVLTAPFVEPAGVALAISSRVKVLCEMDVSDTRKAQDGRATFVVGGRPVDLRVSTVPTSYGESLVIRLLDRKANLLEISNLGLPDQSQEILMSSLQQSRGLIIVTGPTGSGKTTTLYAALNHLRQNPRKILTIEDPVEYYFDDINQVQVNRAAGVDFASALRNFLRQDPDVILVGEIRDEETAKIAMQAALTGHLVLATLHTNDAVSAITRLRDMGVEDYLIASTISAIFAQRLVPRICSQCSEEASNCSSCKGSGRMGRALISEGFALDKALMEQISDGASEHVISQYLKQRDFKSMNDEALKGVREGWLNEAEASSIIGQSFD